MPNIRIFHYKNAKQLRKSYLSTGYKNLGQCRLKLDSASHAKSVYLIRIERLTGH